MKTLIKNIKAAKPAAGPKAVKPASPVAGRRNFRLSGLEILIVVLIVLGVAYLVTMWVSTALSPEQEAAAPAAAPGTLMEKALVASEKAQAQLASLSRDMGALRKDMDNLQARRPAAAPTGPGQQHAPAPSGLERRLDEVEKQLHGMTGQKDDKALAAAAQEIKTLAGRLDRLEKDLAGRAQADKKTAEARPVADSQLLARIERLEQAQTQTLAPQPRKETGHDLSEIEARLNKLEQGLKQVGRETARPVAAQEAPAAPLASRPAIQASPPAPAPRAAAPKPADQRRISYKVKTGDTMLGLARKYKVSLDDIVRWNAQQLGDRRNLLIGETLVIIPGNNS